MYPYIKPPDNMICPTNSTICPICFEEVEIGYKFIVRPYRGSKYFCGHGCCLSCSKPWFAYANSKYPKRLYCPLCRQRIRGVRKYHNLCPKEYITEGERLYLEWLNNVSEYNSCPKETVGEKLYLEWINNGRK